MHFGILGGGFGLYGWLPALAQLANVQVMTLERYRAQMLERAALRDLIPAVMFVADVDHLLEDVTHLVIARRPRDQSSLIEQLADRKWIGCAFLEKPLAPTPVAALEAVEVLERANILVGDGFIMNETSWTAALAKILQQARPASISIDWRFMAHHYMHGSSGWKRNRRAGGGALRFYAIHLIDWLVRRGDWRAIECSAADSSDEDPCVRFAVRNETTVVRVNCDSRWAGSPIFEISGEYSDGQVFRMLLADPFDDTQEIAPNGGQLHDRRVRYLYGALQRSVAGGGASAVCFQPHVRLWNEIENCRDAL